MVRDIDLDGQLDIVVAGNLFAMEAETIRNDAGIGLYLKGNGEGEFTAVTNLQSGLFVDGDVRAMKQIQVGGDTLLLAAKNNDLMQVIRINPTGK